MTILLIIYIIGAFASSLLWSHILTKRRSEIILGDVALFIPMAIASWLSLGAIILAEYGDTVIYKREKNNENS